MEQRSELRAPQSRGPLLAEVARARAPHPNVLTPSNHAPPPALGRGGRRGRCRRPMEEAGGTREEGPTIVVSSLVPWRSRVDVEREGSAAANDEIPSCGSGRERTAKKITHGQFFRVCIRVLLERCFFYALQEVSLAAESAHFACSHPQLAGNSLKRVSNQAQPMTNAAKGRAFFTSSSTPRAHTLISRTPPHRLTGPSRTTGAECFIKRPTLALAPNVA